MIDFLSKWQTLIGAALGPFLLGLGAWFKVVISKKEERKEHLRRIEISITRSLDDTYKTRQKLQAFVSRLRALVTRIRATAGKRNFSLETTNYPTIRDVYRDVEVPNFKIKSYYLHNKILWADAGIKETNETVAGLRNDFADLLRKNELHIALMRQNQNPDSARQREDYAYNLEGFANAVDEFIDKFIKQGIEIMTQVKIYNNHLRKRSGKWFLWKCEGTNFKYFHNKAKQNEFSRNLISLERLDKIIEKEVKSAIQSAEDRAARLLH
ncbi:MAG: hypothetical protein C3F02_00435 [Parcubacteria group bacterium]|nr:MAG: hypothetical protein C3F02_00435 [Parcubacteria group bacterium]